MRDILILGVLFSVGASIISGILLLRRKAFLMPIPDASERVPRCPICMLPVEKTSEPVFYCPGCFSIMHADCVKKHQNLYDQHSVPRCAVCSYRVLLVPGEKVQLEISGTKAKDVEKVVSSLLEKTRSNGSSSRNMRSPWLSGSFYLFALVVLSVVTLIVARTIHIVVLPIVLALGTLSLLTIGILQLRHDKRLSEENFIKLMIEILRALPLSKKNNQTRDNGESGSERNT